jgi:hypothetical protein
MQVDGGVRVEVRLHENAIKPFTVGGQRHRRVYIIRNQQVYPEWQDVKPQLKHIASRAIDSLTKAQGVGDLHRLYVHAQRDGLDDNLAYISQEYSGKPKSESDTAHLNQRFDYAITWPRPVIPGPSIRRTSVLPERGPGDFDREMHHG